MKFVIVIEKGPSNFSAYVPDLPGCIATGVTIDEVEERMRGAIEFHIRGLREDGLEIPNPTILVREVEVQKAG